MNSLFQQVLSTISHQHLLLVDMELLGQVNGEDALLSLVVDTCVESKFANVEILYRVNNELRRLKVELIPVEVIHLFYVVY